MKRENIRKKLKFNKYTTGGLTGDYTADSAISGIASGASMGSVAGPVGSVVGGVIGGISGLASGLDASSEQEAAKKRAIRQMANQSSLQNEAILANYRNMSSPLEYPNGGIVGYTSDGNPIYSNNPATERTASFTPNVLRKRTFQNTVDTATDTLGIPREEFMTSYKADPETYTKTLAKQYPNKYKAEKNSLGRWTLSEYMQQTSAKQKFANGGYHTMSDGTIHPGATHADYMAMQDEVPELETKEVFRTPDGQIEKVPEGTPSHANGGIKLDLPNGTEILGKMKGKNTDGKSYKELGQNIKKRFDKYQKVLDNPKAGKLAKSTAERMMDRVQSEFDILMEDQEVQKFACGGKTGRKNRFDDGGRTNYEYISAIPEEDRQASYGAFLDYLRANKGVIEGYDSPYRYGYGNTGRLSDELYAQRNYEKSFSETMERNLGYGADKFHSPSNFSEERLQTYLDRPAIGGQASKLYDNANAYRYWHENIYAPNIATEDAVIDDAGTVEGDVAQDNVQEQIAEVTGGMPIVSADDLPRTEVQASNAPGPSMIAYRGNELNRGVNTPWWETAGNWLGTAAQFAPAAYNLYQGMFGDVDYLNAADYRNPYTNEIRRDLRDIDYNIRPILEANELAYQTARRNVRQAAPGTGALLSNYGVLAGTRMRADAEAHARKQNEENRLRGSRANIYAQLGAQEARTKLGVDQYNLQADAAKQAALSTGIDQLAGAAFNIGSSRNQRYNNELVGKAWQQYARNYNFNPNDPDAFATFIKQMNYD